MANICSYKVIVKGKKNACYAFFGSMSCLDGKRIIEEKGTEDSYTVQFKGDCKWSVDAYCNPWTGDFPVVLPENPDDAMQDAELKYWYNTVRERSKMFEVEVWCNSADIEDYDPIEGPDQIFEHYVNGEPAGGECPKELVIEGASCNDEDWDDEELSGMHSSEIRDVLMKLSEVLGGDNISILSEALGVDDISILDSDSNSIDAITIARSISEPVSSIVWKDRLFVHTRCKKESAMETCIASKGGVVKSSTVLKTDYIIIGDDTGYETKKITRAKELNKNGKEIKAMTESEFWSFVAQE